MLTKKFLEQEYPDQFGLFEMKDMISFANKVAKYHVEQALKAADNKVEIHSDNSSYYNREFEEGIRSRTIYVAKNSILNAYPLTNID